MGASQCTLLRRLIYNVLPLLLLDIDSVDPSNDLTLFANVMEAMERCSPDASIFILIHKMDLVAEDDREREFAERSALVQSKSDQ